MRIATLISIVTFTLYTFSPSELLAQSASVPEEKPTQEALKIEGTQVTAKREQEQGYAAKRATTATKTDTLLLETPQAVSVALRTLLTDQHVRRLMEAAVYYERGPFRAPVNIVNALDERSFAGSYSDLYARPGEPLEVQATVNWLF